MFVSVNKITVTGCSTEEYERVYREASDFMAKQPGHVRQRLVRSESEPNVYFAIADWESVEHYRQLATIDELVRIFGQVISLDDPARSHADKIKVEHHDCVVAIEH